MYRYQMVIFLDIHEQSICLARNHATELLKLVWRTLFRQAKAADKLDRDVGYVQVEC